METGHLTVITEKERSRTLQYITGMTIQDCNLHVHLNLQLIISSGSMYYTYMYMYTVSSKNLSSNSRGHGLLALPNKFLHLQSNFLSGLPVHSHFSYATSLTMLRGEECG